MSTMQQAIDRLSARVARLGRPRGAGIPARYAARHPGGIPVSVWWTLAVGAAASLAVWLFRGPRLGGAPGGRKVGDVMVREVVAIPPTATLVEAARRMRDANVGALPIVADGQLRGIVTDRDLVVRAMARGLDPGTVTVGECATTRLACARPEWDVQQALEVMAECEIGRLPVVDPADRLVGMVTLSSLALRSREPQEALQTAQQVAQRSARGPGEVGGQAAS